MINKDEITEAGYVQKTHGIKGEVSIVFDIDSFDDETTTFFIFNIDGIFVPFFIEDYRFKSDTTAIYKFEDIDDEKQARLLVGKTVYLHHDHLLETEDNESLHLIGFEIKDKQDKHIGIIDDIDDSTVNVLFVVKDEDKEYLIPATDAYIINIDTTNKSIIMDLPEGLLNPDLAEDDESCVN